MHFIFNPCLYAELDLSEAQTSKSTTSAIVDGDRDFEDDCEGSINPVGNVLSGKRKLVNDDEEEEG